jgi:hypothetical protein
MTGRNEIDFGRLADWAEGRLTGEEVRIVEEQLVAADEATRAEAEWLRAFARAGEEVVFEEPPVEVREELIRRFNAFSEGRREPNLVERLVARLSFDGGLQPAFGVRSAGSGEGQRQLVYSTEAADIALNVRPRPRNGHLDLEGQVFPSGDADPASFSVQLLSGATEVGITATDELGEFAFESIPPGAYQVLVSGERVEILISPVQLHP